MKSIFLFFFSCSFRKRQARRSGALAGRVAVAIHDPHLGVFIVAGDHGIVLKVALGRRGGHLIGGDKRQRDTGVAAGGLHDHGVSLENAAFFRILDHGHADTVLHAAERIEELALQSNRGVEAGGDFVEFDQRRFADGFDDVVVDHGRFSVRGSQFTVHGGINAGSRTPRSDPCRR